MGTSTPRLPSTFKLTPPEVYDIRTEYAGYTQKQIADIFEVHKSTISRILNKKTWKEWIDYYGI